MLNEDLSKINIIYDIKKNDKYINIFGHDFVKNNKNKCKILVDNKEYEITEKYYVNNNINNNLDVKLKGINYVTDMSYMFYRCSALSSLPDISKWNTNNVTGMSYMFCGCSALPSLPDISKWNTNNVTDMSNMFGYCLSLSYLPDISNWNTNNVTDMSYMFYGCSSLLSLPDISKWNTSNVTNMSGMFCRCSSLSSLPDISKWNTNKVKDMNDMFSECSSLSFLFDFSKIYKTKSLLTLFDGIYNVFIKTITGKTFFIYYLNDDTIRNIKNRIKNKEGIPTELQILFYNEKQLEDSKTLEDYKIQNMSILHLALKKK